MSLKSVYKKAKKGAKKIGSKVVDVVEDSVEVVVDTGKSVVKETVKTAKKQAGNVADIAKGTGNVLTGNFKKGFKQMGSGAWGLVSDPITGATNILGDHVESVCVHSDVANSFFAVTLGRDYQKQHDVLTNLDKADDCISRLHTLSKGADGKSRDNIRQKLIELYNVKGFREYIQPVNENIFDQYIDETVNMINEFADTLDKAVNKIKEYSEGNGLEKIFDTTLMAGTKFTEGVLGVFEDIGDAGITALNWVGLIDDDVAEYAVGMEWSKDNAVDDWIIKKADMSAFTEDSLMAGACELAGEIGCYVVLGEVLAPAGMSSVAAQTVIAGTAGFGSGTESAINQGKSIDQARWTGVKTGATQAAIAFAAGKGAEKIQIKGAQKAADKADDAMRASAESLDDMARAANSVDDASKAMLVDNAQKVSDAAHKELDAAKSALEKASGGDAYYKAQENYIKALNKANSADEILNAAKNADDVTLYAKNASKQISNAEDLAKAAHEELDVARDALNKASGEGYFKAENAYQKALEKSKAADQFLSNVKNVSTNADDALRAASSADDLAKAAKGVSDAKSGITQAKEEITDAKKALKAAEKTGNQEVIDQASEKLSRAESKLANANQSYDDAVRAFEGKSAVQEFRAKDINVLDDSVKQAQKAEQTAQTNFKNAEKDLTKAQNEYVKAAKGNDATAKAEARIKADKAEKAFSDAESDLAKAKTNTADAIKTRDSVANARKASGIDTIDDDIAKAAKERKSAEKAFKKEGTMDNLNAKKAAGDKYDDLIAKKASFESDPIKNMTTSIDNVKYADSLTKSGAKGALSNTKSTVAKPSSSAEHVAGKTGTSVDKVTGKTASGTYKASSGLSLSGAAGDISKTGVGSGSDIIGKIAEDGGKTLAAGTSLGGAGLGIKSVVSSSVDDVTGGIISSVDDVARAGTKATGMVDDVVKGGIINNVDDAARVGTKATGMVDDVAKDGFKGSSKIADKIDDAAKNTSKVADKIDDVEKGATSGNYYKDEIKTIEEKLKDPNLTPSQKAHYEKTLKDAKKLDKIETKAAKDTSRVVDKIDDAAKDTSKIADKIDDVAKDTSKVADKIDDVAKDTSKVVDKIDDAAKDTSKVVDKIDDATKDTSKAVDKIDGATSELKGPLVDKTDDAVNAGGDALDRIGINGDSTMDDALSKVQDAVDSGKITGEQADDIIKQADSKYHLSDKDEIARLQRENSQLMQDRAANIERKELLMAEDGAKPTSVSGYDEAVSQIDARMAENSQEIERLTGRINSPTEVKTVDVAGKTNEAATSGLKGSLVDKADDATSGLKGSLVDKADDATSGLKGSLVDKTDDATSGLKGSLVDKTDDVAKDTSKVADKIDDVEKGATSGNYYEDEIKIIEEELKDPNLTPSRKAHYEKIMETNKELEATNIKYQKVKQEMIEEYNATGKTTKAKEFFEARDELNRAKIKLQNTMLGETNADNVATSGLKGSLVDKTDDATSGLKGSLVDKTDDVEKGVTSGNYYKDEIKTIEEKLKDPNLTPSQKAHYEKTLKDAKKLDKIETKAAKDTSKVVDKIDDVEKGATSGNYYKDEIKTLEEKLKDPNLTPSQKAHYEKTLKDAKKLDKIETKAAKDTSKVADKIDDAAKATYENDPIGKMTGAIDDVKYADDITNGTVRVEGFNSDLAKTLRDGDYHGISGLKQAAKDFNSLSLGDKAKNLGKTMVGANTIFSDGPTAAVAAGKAINDYYDKGGTEAFIDRLTAPKIDVSNSVSKADFDAISNNIKNSYQNSIVTSQDNTTPTQQTQEPQETIYTSPTGGGEQSNSTPIDNGNSNGGFASSGNYDGGYSGNGYSGGGYTGPTSSGTAQFNIDQPSNPNVIPETVTENEDIPVDDIIINPSDDIPVEPTGGDVYVPSSPEGDNPSNAGGEVYNPTSGGGETTTHSGGGYSRSGGYSGTNNYISTPGTNDTIKNNVTKGKTSVDDIIKGSKYTKIPTNNTPINKSSGNGLEAVIPIAAGLSAAAAAGIGAKAYLDHKKNNDNDDDYDEEEFGVEEWNGDENNIEIDYDDSSDTNTEQYLDDDDDYDYQPESEEKYGARNSEELADLQ